MRCGETKSMRDVYYKMPWCWFFLLRKCWLVRRLGIVLLLLVFLLLVLVLSFGFFRSFELETHTG